MLAIGIDVGIDGAIAAVGDNGFVRITRMPIIPGSPLARPTKKRKNSPTTISLAGVSSWLKETCAAYSPLLDCVVGIEAQQAMPQQGVVSMFHLGVSYGQLQGLMVGLALPYVTIKPKVWKKLILPDTPMDKAAAIAFAQRLYPTIDLNVGVHKQIYHDGMADALCIATYVRRTAEAAVPTHED